MGIQKKNKFQFSDDSRRFIFVEDMDEAEPLEDFILSLEIPYEGEMKGEEYVVTLPSSNEFSEVYNLVSTNKKLELQDDSIANDEEARFKFKSDDYEISMLADFDDDIYIMAVSRA